MQNREVIPPNYAKKMALDELRERIFRDKQEFRNYLAHAPINEKLRIMEEMRDFTAAMEGAREANKASVRHAWTSAPNIAVCRYRNANASNVSDETRVVRKSILNRFRNWIRQCDCF